MKELYAYFRKIAVAAIIVLLVMSGFYLIARHTHFFLLVFAGILLAVMFTGLANWLSSKVKIGRGLSLTIVCILLLGVLIGLGLAVAPTVAAQVEEMQETVPEAWADLKNTLRQYPWGSVLLEEVEQEDLLPEQQSSRLGMLGGMFASTLGIITDIAIVLVTGLFLAANPSLYTSGFIRLFPVAKRTRLFEVLDKLYYTLQQWLFGMFLAMCLIGVSVWIGFSLLGLKLAMLMAMFAFFFAFIPNVGPIIAGVPPILLGFLESPQMALNVFLVYAVIQGVEGYILTPLIFQKTVDLPPALLLFLQVLFGILEGGLGLLLAAPFLAVSMVLVQELYIKDVLEKEPDKLSFEQKRTKNLASGGKGGATDPV